MKLPWIKTDPDSLAALAKGVRKAAFDYNKAVRRAKEAGLNVRAYAQSSYTGEYLGSRYIEIRAIEHTNTKNY